MLEGQGRINRKKLIQMLEVIQMGEDVKQARKEKFFTEDELKEFEEVGKKHTPEMTAPTSAAGRSSSRKSNRTSMPTRQARSLNRSPGGGRTYSTKLTVTIPGSRPGSERRTPAGRFRTTTGCLGRRSGNSSRRPAPSKVSGLEYLISAICGLGIGFSGPDTSTSPVLRLNSGPVPSVCKS